MPFAGFKDFDACVLSMVRDGKSQAAAKRICGKLKADHEKKRGTRRKKRAVQEPYDADFTGAFAYSVVVEKSDLTYTLGPALIPDVVDKQGDVISAEDIEKAAHDWMASGCPLGMMHQQLLTADDGVADESYIIRNDMTISAKAYTSGTWMVGIKWFNPEIRKSIKQGNRRAYSIGGHGRATELA